MRPLDPQPRNLRSTDAGSDASVSFAGEDDAGVAGAMLFTARDKQR
jgi:hypothetical protein